MIRSAALGLAFVLAACSTTAPSGTLGLPSARQSTGAPTASPRTTAPPTGSAALPSASASQTAATASASPSATATPTPRVTLSPADRATVSNVTATQLFLSVRYSAAMRTEIACGGSGQPSRTDGAIDYVLKYLSNDRALDEAIQSATQASITADCTTVTFLFGVAAPSGTFTVGASGMVDRQDNAMNETRNAASVTIADQDRPRVTSAASTGDRLTVTFSEPMLEFGEAGGAALLGNYRLDGNVPAASEIACVDRGCRSVALTMRPGVLVPGRSHSLGVANAIDRAGRNIAPDPTTLSFTAR